MKRICPPAVLRGEPVAVVAPAGPVDPEALSAGVAWLDRRYRPVVGGGITEQDGYLAGSDDRRLAELQGAIDNPELRAVLAARGGYGTTRILDRLALGGLAKAPKWVVGSSDLTALLAALYADLGLVSIHGPMAFRYGEADAEDLRQLVDLLEGRPWIPPAGLGSLARGEARGPLIGGNLTVLAHLAGALPDRYAEGAILFLEDVGESPYRLDRHLVQLARAGILPRAAGIVLGEFTDCRPGSDGVSAEEVMRRSLRPIGIPVAVGYPAAHGKRNYPFLHGGEVVLKAGESSAELIALA